MLQWLVRLKQKDLNAVSAAQILSNHPISCGNQQVRLTGLDYYQLVSVDVDSNAHSLVCDAVNDSYIFSNPNKQVLTPVSDAIQMVDEAVYAHVFRHTPVNLSRYCKKLNALLGQSVVRSVYMSDIWQITVNVPCDLSLIESQWVVSGAGVSGLFAHPLIHSTRMFYGVNFFSNINDTVNSCNH